MNLDQLKALGGLGWWLAAGALLLLVLWEGIKKWGPALLEKIGRGIASVLAGTRLVRRFSLRTYRQQIELTWSKLPVLFADDVELDVSTIYVPLQAVGTGDAHLQIRETDHVVVLGPPGAGKSMLLRHSMLTWARGDVAGRVPVLLELHRCNGNTTSLEELIVEQFDRDGFRKAGRFVERALRTGGLSVLFDGLDEVNAAERERVVGLIKNFTVRNFGCQIVVTCRTAVYNRDLSPEIGATFHVQEFDERLIRRFLRQWPDFGSIEQLMTALRDSPRIMQLARNPLLLSMIAYLYEKGGTLPHSRAEFYRDAILELLRIKKNNRYPRQAKTAVLRHLALVAQDVPAHEVDRRTLPYEKVLDEISTKLSSLSIPVEQAPDVLSEIVERNGLMLAVDGGERYSFAHLSLQEFLAAEALEQDRDGLLERYRRAPDDWRETVKLWCGLASSDCADVIKAVFELDPVLAFECLADAQVVDEAVANKITKHFQKRLDDSPAVIAAFGAVASDKRIRGRMALTFLANVAREPGERGAAARKALAATKLPQAAELLVERGGLLDVVSMGDLAVPVLARPPRGGLKDAIDALFLIGTPAAAQALGTLIWFEDEFAARAAWYLAVLIADPEVEAGLAEVEVVSRLDRLDWVWAPFAEDAHGTTRQVVGRIAFLVNSTAAPGIPGKLKREIDPRLALPLLAFPLSVVLMDRFDIGEEIRSWDRKAGRLSGASSDLGDFDEEFHERISPLLEPYGSAASIYNGLGYRVRASLVLRLAKSGVALREQDWTEVRSDADPFQLRRSWPHTLAWLVIGALGLAAVTMGVVDCWNGWSAGPTWLGWIWVSYAALAMAIVWVASFLAEDVEPLDAFLLLVELIRDFREIDWDTDEFLGSLVAPWAPAMLGLVFVVGVPRFGWAAVLGAVGLVVLIAVALMTYGARRERKARNPLRGLLELDERAARTRTSVIAG